MALLGTAAMLLWYDILPEQIAEHDDWHTRQHFPERVGIPGFIRAHRWVARSPGTRYFVAYEVSGIETLSSAPYLERLNNPTEWTTRMMPSFRGMARGFCRLEMNHGDVLGTSAATLRYSIAPGREEALLGWLDESHLPALLAQKGFASAHRLRSSHVPEMTAEQRIRGRDASVDHVLIVTGYSHALMSSATREALCADTLAAHGAMPGAMICTYDLACLAEAQAR